MDHICRLCCSTKFVNNHIFDDENALFLKMSYLPIKVLREDRLPQRVCDRCSCRVNDLYQFCNESIEVQHRLRSIFLSSQLQRDNSFDLPIIKDNVYSPQGPAQCERSTQTESLEDCTSNPEPEVKQEVKPFSPTTVKTEDNTDYYVYDNMCNDVPSDNMCNDVPSDNSDDISLIDLKKKKNKSVKPEVNGVTENKRGRRRKKDLKDWKLLMKALPSVALLASQSIDPVKMELQPTSVPVYDSRHLQVKQEPTEPDKYDCCICFVQCYSRAEMLQHYRQHGAETEQPRPPAPEAPPDMRPLRCPRCAKVLEPAAWAAHWMRHWERDRRPYRCARCEKTFSDPHQILKHGLTHKNDSEASLAGAEATLGKRFVCDLCPEGFVYMRYLLAHRTRAHPEAAARALALRCAECAREFAHLNSLRRHLRAHSGERNFLCSVCGKALSSREHLKFHLRIHAGYKPNICKTCGKGFVKKCNLTLHERVHSGEKPHVCSHCGKAFSQRSTLVIHERYHSGARPYVCGLCGRGFVAKGLLSMHLKTTCI